MIKILKSKIYFYWESLFLLPQSQSPRKYKIRILTTKSGKTPPERIWFYKLYVIIICFYKLLLHAAPWNPFGLLWSRPERNRSFPMRRALDGTASDGPLSLRNPPQSGEVKCYHRDYCSRDYWFYPIHLALMTHIWQQNRMNRRNAFSQMSSNSLCELLKSFHWKSTLQSNQIQGSASNKIFGPRRQQVAR